MNKKEIKNKVKDLESQIKELKEQLEEKPKLEVGKWYIDDYHEGLTQIVCFQGGFSGYGLCGDSWHNNSDWGFENNQILKRYRPATDKEVETALIEEAKRRYKKGDVIDQKSAYNCGGGVHEAEHNRVSFSVRTNGSYNISFGGVGVFSTPEGKWAEIIEDKAPKINGYKLEEIDAFKVQFGCAKFYKRDLQMLEETCREFGDDVEHFRGIKSITLDSGVEITIEELKEVVDYLDR